MSARSRRHFLGAAALALLAGPLAAALPETLAEVKKSIVAVGSFHPTRSPQFRFFGTGFVVGNGNQVFTNAHVAGALLGNADPSERLVIALPGSGRTQVRGVLSDIVDRDHDLALLRFDGPSLPALRLGDSDAVREGQDIALTGFPLGATIGIVPVTHRGIVSAITPVGQPLPSARQLDAQTLRRLAGGGYAVFQLDAVCYPGNSGSPVYDAASGEVIGIVNMVFVKGSKESAVTAPSGITYAIPVSFMKALLAR